MKTYLGLDSHGKRVKMIWSGSMADLADSSPEIVWYAALNEGDDLESIVEKAKSLGITPELYQALEAMGAE